MNQMTRTILFAVLAAASVAVAFGTHRFYTPKDLDEFIDVGKAFYPDFQNPNEATALQVASYDKESGQTKVFKVEFADNLWRIPTHHNYPADAKDQLAKTASSMIGVKRDALVERTSAAHKRYRLLDPNQEESEDAGDRISLFKNGTALVDIIVGNKVEGEEEVYYVRRADEDRFYTANLGSLKISTKFSDWIATDILDVNKNKIREIVIDRHSVDEASGRIIDGDQVILTRAEATAPWQMDGLDPAKEAVNATELNQMVTALDELAIVGVRPKPASLSADLKSNEGISMTRAIMIELQSRGFFFHPREGRLVSNEGELIVGTDDGVAYVLRFGEEFSGTDVDLEVGSEDKKTPAKDESKTTDEASEDATADQKDADAEAAESESTPAVEENADPAGEAEDGLKKSRYLFVSVQLNSAQIGKEPVPPTKPTPPKEEPKPAEAPAEETKDDGKEAAAESEKADDKEAEASDESPKDDSPAAEAKTPPAEDAPPPKPKVDPKKAYEAALARYEEELEVYDIKKKEFDEKLASANDRVKELNNRFADWYYVISSDVFDRLKLDRAALVEPAKAPPVNPNQPNIPAPRQRSNPELLDTSGLPAIEPEMKKPTEEPAKEPAPTEKPMPKEGTTPAKDSPAKDSPASKKKEKSEADPKKETAPKKEDAPDKPVEPKVENPEPATPEEPKPAPETEKPEGPASSETEEDAPAESIE